MITFTTTNLVDGIKRTAHVPVGNNTFTFEQFLQIADIEMRTGIAPKIASARENYWLTTARFPIDSTSNKYRIPSKALGGAIVDVKIDGGDVYTHLLRMEVGSLYSSQFNSAPAYSYYLEDGCIQLLPADIGGELVMWYYRIPSQLVATSACGQITSIVGNDVTVAALPSTFVGGAQLDIVGQTPGFYVLLKDEVPVSVVGNTITFAAVPSDVAVGDWVCLAGQSCVVQCPLEWVGVLEQRCAVKIYEIQGYEGKRRAAKDSLDEMEKAALSLVSPRTIENPKVIIGGGSLLSRVSSGWSLPVKSGV